MEPNPYESPQGPPEPRPKPRWRLPDVVVLIYGAGIVFGAPLIIAAKLLSWFWTLPRV